VKIVVRAIDSMAEGLEDIFEGSTNQRIEVISDNFDIPLLH
jgi:hypothetical protein